MKTYRIKKVDKKLTLSDSAWKDIESADVNCFPWSVDGYKPHTTARVVWSDSGLTIKMETDEKPLLARFTEDNSEVYEDSCMEFFIGVDKESKYLNFELNPNGAMLLSYGADRNFRTRLDFDRNLFEIESKISDEKWELKFLIPFSFTNQYFTESADPYIFYGNFYKCGNETEQPHHGCWNKIETPRPDFHRPEFFGKFEMIN